MATSDSGYTTSANTALTITAGSLLANDSDPDGDTLSVTGASNPTNGTVSYNATTKEVTFTPTSNYTGPASFSYAITDNKGGTSSASVSLSVNAPSTTNRNPVATSDSGYTTSANTALTIT
ncbi:cadherin-like domain-containing protein, partial [Microvirga sp. 0TCS3.31]